MSQDYYKHLNSSNNEVIWQTAKTVTPPKPAALVVWSWLVKLFDAAASFVGTSVRFIGLTIDTAINALSKLISIKIGLLDTSKVHLCEEIKRLEGELADVRLKNKRLDSENYILCESIAELERGGNMAYDKCVQWFGSDCEQAVRWRDAVSQANAALGLTGDDASKYYVARSNQQWVKEYEDQKKEDEKPEGRSSSKKRKRKR